jgi:FemAB-related protein (PEP-CTERM system-associated)
LSKVKRLTPGDETRWDDFVRHNSEGTFYHLSAWQSVIGTHLGHPTYYLYVEQGGRIDGVLPLARVKSMLFGDALISLPFLVYGGPVSNSDESNDALIDHAKSLAEEFGVDYLELRNRRPLTDWPTKNNYVTFRRAIEPDVEANLMAIPRKQRAVIRKAIKTGLVAEFDERTDRLYDILSECKRNLGTPFFSGKYLSFIKDIFGDDCEILTVLHDGEALTSVMSFRFRNEILPYYGGGGMAARRFGANDFMYWKVLENACEQGVEVFDFGRSRKDTGPYNFKKYWGFEPEQLSYEFYLVKSKEMPKTDPSSGKYQKFINAWSRLPLPLARMIGPPLARLLG